MASCGQILLKFATGRMDEIRLEWAAIPTTLSTIFLNPFVIIGTFLFVTSMVLWIKVISTMELSRAYPSIGVSYVIIFAFSVLFFRETVTSAKVLGIILISGGVVLLHQ